MTNMSQAPATEKKGVSDLLGFKIFGMPLPLYAFALITLLLSHFYNALPTDIVGGFAIMFIIGAIFGEIGKRLPIFNKYIGGAPVMIFLVAAYFVYAGIFTQKEIDAISNVMDKSNFLNLFIAVLITGAILSVNRRLLLKSLLGYIPTILMGIVGASIFGIAIGLYSSGSHHDAVRPADHGWRQRRGRGPPVGDLPLRHRSFSRRVLLDRYRYSDHR